MITKRISLSEAREVKQRGALVRAPFYFINLWLITDRHRYWTYLYYLYIYCGVAPDNTTLGHWFSIIFTFSYMLYIVNIVNILGHWFSRIFVRSYSGQGGGCKFITEARRNGENGWRRRGTSQLAPPHPGGHLSVAQKWWNLPASGPRFKCA